MKAHHMLTLLTPVDVLTVNPPLLSPRATGLLTIVARAWGAFNNELPQKHDGSFLASRIDGAPNIWPLLRRNDLKKTMRRRRALEGR